MIASDRTARLAASWLHAAPLRDLLAALDGDGEEARVVGGAVRNALLGEPHGDIDIATTAVPDEVIEREVRCSALGLEGRGSAWKTW